MPRRLIDLSMPVRTGHFRWPVERRLAKSHAEGAGSEATWAGWNVHAFTHMDNPTHMDPDGATTDDITLGIPRLRKGSYFPSFLEPRRTAESL